MKKLMFSAAVAALAGASFADGVVYEMVMSVKTTKAVNGTVKDACDCYTGKSVYRKQASYKVKGLFWGCDCYLPSAVLVDRDPYTALFASGEGNYIFWNITDKGVWANDEEYLTQDFQWNLLGRIGNRAAECEGAWTLEIGDLNFMGAGFGKVTGCEEATIVKSMSGNFAGYWNPGQGCMRCADNADAYWPLCECGEDDNLTAAYGTWSLKYNSDLSKKFSKGAENWVTFPTYVEPAIAQFVNGADPTPTSDVQAKYDAAKAALAKAQATLDTYGDKVFSDGDVEGQKLVKARTAAQTALNNAEDKVIDTEKAYKLEQLAAANDKVAADAAVVASNAVLVAAQEKYAKEPTDANKYAVEKAKEGRDNAVAAQNVAQVAYEEMLGKLTATPKANLAAYVTALEAYNVADAAYFAWRGEYYDITGKWVKGEYYVQKDAATKAKNAAEEEFNLMKIACTLDPDCECK